MSESILGGSDGAVTVFYPSATTMRDFHIAKVFTSEQKKKKKKLKKKHYIINLFFLILKNNILLINICMHV